MDKLKYVVNGVLGAGTFGTVYKCQSINGDTFCVKRIPLDVSSAAVRMHQKHIMQEIYLLKNLKHPRIVKMLEYFTESFKRREYISIIMEYAENGSLAALLHNQKHRRDILGEETILKYFTDILLGLEFLHLKNVIHKDLKPENILISKDYRLKIADFGVSKIVDTMNTSNQRKEVWGTPLYMAPEILVSNFFSFASDVWALGCILYEICTLSSPFEGAKNMDDLIRRTLGAVYRPIGTRETNCDEKLVLLCTSMLNANHNKRAKIQDIISSDLIVRRYYRNYFDIDSFRAE